ncbi:MAG: primosomal protein N' [Clostridia bacterium]|nr:primosomal protein N' [Clostridia bacterium]
MRYANVIVDLSAEALDRLFSYSIPEDMDLLPGQQVLLPFGPRKIEGFVVSISDSCALPPEKVKDVIAPMQAYPVVLPELMDLAHWMHERYLCNLVDALRLMIPSELRNGSVRIKNRRFARLSWDEETAQEFISSTRAKRQAEVIEILLNGEMETARLNPAALKALREKGAVEIFECETRRTPSVLSNAPRAQEFSLMPGQKRAVDAIVSAMDSGGGRFLLNGVTGSGKTEVYIRAIRHALEAGRSAIVLVPEIALTPQMVSWVHASFGDLAAVLHSGLSAGEKFDEWRRIRFGEARVVVGARSAIFAPLENIGAIIVDEEHENTYQSESRPRYDARELAWRRAEENRAVLVLGSATPSISSFMRAMPGVRPENRLELLEMRERVQGRPMPEVELVDMRSEFERGNHSIFSAKLTDAMNRVLERGEQAMLFINRRGHSTFVSCRKCGYVVKCPQCDVSMTYHRTNDSLRCHYCGNTAQPPKTCPECGSSYIKYFGAGTQKVAEEAEKHFPLARIVRMDIDTTREKNAHEKILNRFRSGEANLLIGTQMIAKGLDFPNVTLVGVVAADSTLNLPDYRSTERTFQLITQVAGRAGRAQKPGRVIVQTYDPDHYGVQLAAQQDYRAFYRKESAFRRSALYPPFTQIMRIVYSGKDLEKVQAAAKADEEGFKRFLEENNMRPDVVQMRALEAPITLLRGEHRWQLFLKMYFKGELNAACEEMQRMAGAAPDGVRAELEVNPTNMY